MDIRDYVAKEKDYIVSLRRYFHQNPEASLKEYNTALKIEQELDKIGVSHKRVGETGVFASIKGKKESDKKLVLRADIDALPIKDEKDESYHSTHEGFMHACGHDAHTASLLGAVKVLKEKEDEFAGEINFFFQQAEEIGQGARVFIKEGYLKGVSRVFGIHVSSDLDYGTVSVRSGATNASCDYFKIEVSGQSAHVSTPQNGTDALYIASQIVVNLQAIVARQTNPVDTVVVGIGTLHSGTAYNVISGKSVIEGTTRSFSHETRHKVNSSVVDIAKQIGEAYGARVDVTFKDYASPLVNDDKVCNEVKEIARNILGDHGVITKEKSLGADDFAEYLLKVPGMYAFVGTRNVNRPNTALPHHCGLFDIDEDALLVATNLYVDYALSHLIVNN
ncbi:amidohydrolase [Desulfitobacterium sp. Sab5]|uniref:amidohydrolase n=1 Tax=Desulfitobacterium nosdiversum TaxID=3375356 RepID=UPI003CF478B0